MMEQINLYRYVEDGAVIITPHKRKDSDLPSMIRLVAGEGMTLTDGSTVADVYDVPLGRVSEWTEIPTEISEMSEVEEKATAFDILMGVVE